MKTLKYISLVMVALFLSSCLKSGLDELPAFEDAEITNFKFEYRWMDDTNQFSQLRVVQMDVQPTIDEAGSTVDCIVTVPLENGDFTTEVRNQVNLSNLVGYADISNAAILRPVGSSPKLGIPNDFSQSNMTYEVIAADGKTKKIWQLNITDFVK